MDTVTPLLSSIGIDIGKEVFYIVGFDIDGKIAFRRKIKRLALIETFRKLPPCVIGIEACLTAHFVSRTLRQLGRPFPGGNDCLTKESGVESIEVRDPNETKRVIEAIIACL